LQFEIVYSLFLYCLPCLLTRFHWVPFNRDVKN